MRECNFHWSMGGVSVAKDGMRLKDVRQIICALLVGDRDPVVGNGMRLKVMRQVMDGEADASFWKLSSKQEDCTRNAGKV